MLGARCALLSFCLVCVKRACFDCSCWFCLRATSLSVLLLICVFVVCSALVLVVFAVVVCFVLLFVCVPGLWLSVPCFFVALLVIVCFLFPECVC